MNQPPEILLNSGYVTDQNGVLTEIVIPKTVTTLNAPSKVTFLGTALSNIPSSATGLQVFEAPNVSSLSYEFGYYTSLTTVTMDGVTTITSSSGVYGSKVGGTFVGCKALQEVNFASLEAISVAEGYTSAGPFYNCKNLTTLNMPKLQSVTTIYRSAAFYGCTGLVTVSLPSLQWTSGGNNDRFGGCFNGCTSLTDVTLGSDGHAVQSLAVNTFQDCTQSGLTITIYTQGGASLAGEPWGATGAAIEYEEA